MSKVNPSVLADALRLAPDARAELAAELLAGLEPWDDVRHRIEKELLGR